MYKSCVAVVGAGFIGPVHVEALRRLGIRVKGVLGSSENKSRAAAEAMGLEIGYSDFKTLLADTEIDAVHITSPNKFHFEQVKAVLTVGKHVMCEKPITIDSGESAELVRLAEESGLVCGVNYNIRYYPLNIESKTRAGDMGRIHEINGGYAQDWLLNKEDYNWRVLSEISGPLRAIGDIGTHWLDLITYITGKKIKSVCADLYNIHPVRKRPVGEVKTFSAGNSDIELEEVSIDTEDGGNVLLRFEDGSRGSLNVSQVSAGRKNRIHYEISGAEETLVWDGEIPNKLWIGRRGKMNLELIKNPAIQSEAANYVSDYPGGHAEGFSDSHKQCFKAFYDAVEGRDSLVSHPSFSEGHQEMLLCDAILESSRNNCWVDVKK